LVSSTGPGTPGGEMMRRYWQPAGLSREVTPGGKPIARMMMDEELVLFRDDAGRPGLLGMHCSHRLTSLGYGRVEDGGIRCPFHGWLYDVGGHCLEQPAEPEGSTFKDRIRHTAYPCEELGGLIWAYMGPPDLKPLLPRYQVLVREDGTRAASFYLINSNYLQNVEGAVDTAHFSFLHADPWSIAKQVYAASPRMETSFVETEYGIRQSKTVVNPRSREMGSSHNYFIMPAGFMGEARGGEQEYQVQSWYMPIDDTHTRRFQVAFRGFGADGAPYPWPEDNGYIQPGPENDYFRDYENVDTICGIPLRVTQTSGKGLMAQDNMVNESQGPIEDRTREHLGVHDVVLTAQRMMMIKSIDAMHEGADPKHIIRDASANDVVYVR
ncbi:MAG: phthalate 4,5-dioxygenase, partial [Chloroflexi bacterium]|nr:phthalate 4,5-dioxygenase [Chloroflexota bacterium]